MQNHGWKPRNISGRNGLGGGGRKGYEGAKRVWKRGAKNRRGESGKPNNRPAPTSVSVRSSGEKEEMKWTVRLTGIYILSCAICVSELCRVTVRRIRSGKSVIITRARGAHRSILLLFPRTFARALFLSRPFSLPFSVPSLPHVRFSHRHLTAWNTKINNDSPRSLARSRAHGEAALCLGKKRL